MHNDDYLRSENGFAVLDEQELMETSGGLYKGPVLPHVWVRLLIDRIRNRED